MKKTGKDKYDIVIIGGGPAGCSAAKFLSGKYKILMVDRLKFPRTKTCGGLLVEESQSFLEKFYKKPPENVFSQPKYLNLKIVDWNNNIEKSFKRKIWNVSRKNFDKWLLEQTRNSVCFFSRTSFLGFRQNKKTRK